MAWAWQIQNKSRDIGIFQFLALHMALRLLHRPRSPLGLQPSLLTPPLVFLAPPLDAFWADAEIFQEVLG